MRPKFRKKAGKPITLPYEIVVKTVHGQSVPVKVYAAQYAVGASDHSHYQRKNPTGTTLGSAETLSKARWGAEEPGKAGRKSRDT